MVGETGTVEPHKRDPYYRGVMLGLRAAIPPHQHDGLHHQDPALAHGYIDGAREFLARHGYPRTKVGEWVPQDPNPSDLNYLRKGLLRQSPGIDPLLSRVAPESAKERQIHGKFFRFGLFLALVHTNADIPISDLPLDDAGFTRFVTEHPTLFGEENF